MSRVAMCPDCERPLISTMIFSKAEFFCRKCKRTLGYLEPDPAEDSPELQAIIDADEKWFRPIASKCMPIGGKLRTCDKCRTTGDYSHADHATEQEKKDSKAAYHELLNSQCD